MRKKVLSAILALVTAVTCMTYPVGNAVAAGNIPEGAKSYQGNYYYVYEDADSWEDAKAKCESRGGHLATITSEGEDDIVYQCLEDSGYDDGYFGLYRDDSGTESVWKWVTGEKVVYTNWKPGEPNADYGGTEAFGGYWGGEQWNDFRTSELSVYICEWEGCTIRLNEQSLIMKPGASEYLEYSVMNPDGIQINKSATWKSSNTKVAKVSAQGKVSAINPGHCTVTCRVENSSKKVKIVVVPRKVTKLSVLSKTKNSVQLKWKKQNGVRGYIVYMYNPDLKKYKKVKNASGTFQTAVIRNLRKGKTYRFKVCAYVRSGSKNYNGDYSKVCKVRMKE
ncbi:hypothetical protein E5329_02675 [Petralouisia muris]|uniref:Uncharacterized protein n=1 Tax=Petralouisia muris TaxID=3032872 RepID=A0AC61S1C7_9FIRM|nr:lectin-like protein [Petralouisia muris]TGY97777.1 hypothetical protein E5329_02675 [Petralouisia muris]